jgi:hypothetical protein
MKEQLIHALNDLRANRAALNREDEADLVHHAKNLARSAMLFPSLIDWNAVAKAEELIKEARKHEPR